MKILLPLLSLSLLAGCSLATDPMSQPGTWHATGINDRNLALMVANPADLKAGTGATTSRGVAAARAIDRLNKDKRRTLPTIGASKIGLSNDPSEGSQNATP